MLNGTGSLVNGLLAGTEGKVPEVGMGVTFLGWTDRNPGTIVWVSEDKKTIKVTRDKYTRIDDNGMSESQEYVYESVPDAPVSTYTLRKNGMWVHQGQTMKGGSKLHVGEREKYHDYCF